MKTAGELLAAFFNERFADKAQGYSDLFSSWTGITERCGISAAGAHSRIFELEKNSLLVETDHPGWIQALQTKRTQLLKALQTGFPALEIKSIAFFYSRDPQSFAQRPEKSNDL